MTYCQSTCGPTAEMAVEEHLREAEMEGLGEESARYGHRGGNTRYFVRPARVSVAFQRDIPPTPCGTTWRQLVVLRELHSHSVTSHR